MKKRQQFSYKDIHSVKHTIQNEETKEKESPNHNHSENIRIQVYIALSN